MGCGPDAVRNHDAETPQAGHSHFPSARSALKFEVRDFSMTKLLVLNKPYILT